MEILNSLSLAQWIFIIIGVGIAGSAALPWVKTQIDNWQSGRNKVVVDNDDLDLHDCHEHDLTNLVCKWECLADACKYMGLEEASAKLDEVFPLLIKVRTDDSEEEEF